MLHDKITLSQTLSDGGTVYMQHKRNKISSLASSDDLSDHDLIEFVQIRMEFASLRGTPVDMPIVSYDAWKRILACAKRGARIGKGRQRPPKTLQAKLKEKAVSDFMLAKKQALVEGGMKATGANSAEDQACEEAAVYANERFGWTDLTSERIRNLRLDPMFKSRD